MVMTAVDSLDTLSIMGLEQEFRQAVQLVLEKLDLKQDHFVSLFETNIRVLGGLLVGYEISQEQGLLDKAKELGDALMKGFDPSSGIPHALVNLHTGETRDFNWNMGHSLLAEIGTLQLEFAALSKHTKNPSYRERSLEIFDKIIQFSQDGLSDIYFSTSSGRPSNRHTTLGAMGDSYYEYLLKVYLYLGRSSTKLKDAYIQAMNSIIDRLTVKTSDGLAFVSELHSGSSLGNKMDHLTCFLPGVLALGVDQEVVQGDLARKHLKAAEDIALTCAEMYLKMPTGLAPETFEKGPNGITAGSARYYLLRPETVESLFVLWRVTHKSIYREKAWAIFNGIEKSCRTNMGYAPVTDVTNPSAPKRGKMESFLLAETFKYLYLIFADDSVIPLSDYVFNTEAHPFKLD
jgi:mannosyl-oligosaccharide alpha-1,2-mannosidase